MADSPILKVILQAVDQISPEAAKAGRGISDFVDSTKRWMKGLTAFLGGLALGAFFKSTVDEALKAEASITRLSNAVITTGSDFGAWRDEIEDTVRSVMRMSTATDDDLYEALVRLVTISGNVKGSLNNLQLVADIAAYKQISLSDAADKVAKAMNGNVREFTRMGIAGKDADAVLTNARATFSGFAENESKTMGGALKQISNWWGEVKEAIGKAILGQDSAKDSTGFLVEKMSALALWLEKNETQIMGVVSVLVDVGKALLDVAVTVWDVVGPPLTWLAKYVGGALLIALDVLVNQVRFVTGAIRAMAGGIIEALGFLIEHGGGLLKKFGIDVVESSGASMKKYGETMTKNANEMMGRALGDTQATVERLLGIHKEGNARVEAEGRRSIRTRQKDDEDAAKEAEKLAEKIAKAKEKANEHVMDVLAGTAKKMSEILSRQAKETETDIEKIGEAFGVKLFPVAQRTMQMLAVEYDYMLERGRRYYEQGKLSKDSWEQLQVQAAKHKNLLIEMLPPIDSLKKDAEAIAAASERDASAALKRKFDYKVIAGHIVDGARAALDLGQAFGVVDSKAAAVLNSIINMGSSIAKVAGGDMSGIVGIIGGLANVISNIGTSEVEKKRQAAAAANTLAIDRLTREVGNFNLNATGKVFNGVQSALDAAEAARKDARARGLGPGDADKAAEKAYFLALAKAGVSQEEAKALFKELMGRDMAEANKSTKFADLMAFKKALGVTEFGQYGNDFESQLKATEKAISLYGYTSNEDKLKEYSKLANFSPAIMAALKSDDPKQALLALFEKSRNGGISAAEAGDLTATQMVGLIETFVSLISGPGSLAGLFGGASAGSFRPNDFVPSESSNGAGVDVAMDKSNNGSITADEVSITFESGSVVVNAPAPTGDVRYDAKAFAESLGVAIDEVIAEKVRKKQLLSGA